MTLAETQALFAEAITGGAPLPVGRLEACFAGTPGLPAAARVAIYADMYRWRLIAALRETFPSRRTRQVGRTPPTATARE